ncbi:MAG: ribosomal protein S18-alanine N-acetyltransferase [Aigarchaeota archaeon]|nr:ribosomal protein S18-alanine N-acetyltransferase [Candidatus Pelearchaeum maunauluense]
MSGATTIRRAALNDLLAIYDIERKSFNHPYGFVVFLTLLASPSSLFLVAEDSGRVVGYAVARVEERNALLLSIAVHPQHRRRGVGALLLRSIIRQLPEEVEYLDLQVAVSNSAAISFYEKHGFEKVGKIPRYYKDGEDAYIMRLALTS